MDLEPLDKTLPIGSVEAILRKARLMQKRLSTDEAKVKLQGAQQVTARCLGYKDLFNLQKSASLGRQNSFDGDPEVTKSRQRIREISVLCEFLPHLTRNVIEEFVDSWRLMNWSLLESGGVETEGEMRIPSLTSSKEAELPVTGVPCSATYRPAEVDMGSWVVPECIEVSMPPTLDFASNKARALPAILSEVGDDEAHALTARIYGFESWSELERNFRPASRSKFDEELAKEELNGRRQWQRLVLQGCLKLSKIDAVSLRVNWKPTSQSLDYRNISCDKQEFADDVYIDERRQVPGRLSLKGKVEL
jgi:hypothetical protein